MATTKFDKIIEAIGDLVKPVQEEIQKEEENNSCVRELYMVKTKLEEAALWLGRASFIAEDPISLPEEVDPDEAEATEKHGLLVLKLPKIDKNRQTKLKIKSI